MKVVPNLPPKVQFLQTFSFAAVDRLCQKTQSEVFIGGRPGYKKSQLFFWLLVKKLTNWDYRTIATMAGVSHPTLIRANSYFLQKRVYEQVVRTLVKEAYKQGFITGEKVAMDSSFVHTFSKRGEFGSEGWNEWKKAYGFKVHLLIDCKKNLPLSLAITNGLAHDVTLAIALLKKARPWLRNTHYVLGDKGYDSTEVVQFIAQSLKAKAAIPISKRGGRGKNYSWESAWRNFQVKAKGRSLKKSIYNHRTSIERVFSQLKRTYHLGKEETRGILNFAKNVYLSLISYMLKHFWRAGVTFC